LTRFLNRRRAGIPVVVAAVALLLVGCSSSSHSNQTSSPTTVSPTSAAGAAGTSAGCSSTEGVRGVSGSQITVSGLVTVLDFGTGIDKAAEARFNQANDNNELPCGRKIKYLPSLDDQGTPDLNLTDIRRQVSQEGVFGIVPALTPSLESGATFINQQHVPTVGWGVAPGFCQPPNPSDMYLFGINGCLVPPNQLYQSNVLAGSMAKLFENQGKTSAQPTALIGDDSDASKAGNAGIGGQLAAVGFKIVYSQNPMPAAPSVVTDFTPYVEAIMTANGGHPPTLVYVTSGPANAFGLSRALQQAGYKGVISHSTYAPQLAAQAKGDTVQNTFATTESNSPAMSQIVSTLHAAGVTQIGQPELAAYYSADMFIQILKKVGPDLTPQNFQTVAGSFTYSIPGVIGPTYYPQGYQVGPPCSELVYSNGVSWSVAVPYACYGNDFKKVGGKWVPVPYPSGVGS
jgi:Periplasmic binding protein